MFCLLHSLPIVKKTLVCSSLLYTLICGAVSIAIMCKYSYCRGFDDEMRAMVARNLEGRGINLHPRTTLTQVFSSIMIV